MQWQLEIIKLNKKEKINQLEKKERHSIGGFSFQGKYIVDI